MQNTTFTSYSLRSQWLHGRAAAALHLNFGLSENFIQKCKIWGNKNKGKVKNGGY